MAENQTTENKNGNLTEMLSELWYQCKKHWTWFVISFVVIVGFKAYTLLKTQPLYQRSATILVKEETTGAQLGNMAATLGELGGFGATSRVDNELEAIKSPAVTEKVIDILKLNVGYTKKGRIREATLYGSNQPFVTEFPEAINGMSYEVKGVVDGDTYTISEIKTRYGKKKNKYEDLDISVNFSKKDSVETPVGKLVFSPNERFKTPLFKEEDDDKPYKVIISYLPPKAVIEWYNASLRAELANRRASVINISVTDASTERAEDILNTVIHVYNQYWIDDKNQMSTATADFINQRLGIIQQELLDVDRDITRYKSKNVLPDLETSIKTDIERQSARDAKILELQSQLTMAQSLYDFIKDPANATNVLPSLNITGMAGGEAVTAEITEYNKTLMDRNRLFQTTSAKNPVVLDYDARLSGMRNAISESLKNQVDQLKTALKDQIADRNRTTERIANGPMQANDLLGIERQQKVKESLYLFLLEKREENDLSQAFTAYNTRVLTPPMGSSIPIAPKFFSSLIIAIFFAILVPLGLIYIRMSFDNYVRSKADVDSKLKAPFLGSIPFCGKKPSWWKRLLRKKNVEDRPSEILVKRGNGSAVNEAFRMVRSNLDLMNSRLAAGREDKTVVTMITSAIPGSGKTFVSLNLAAAYALKKMKVVVVDVDLRKGTLSKSFGSPRRGVTAYLSGQADVDDIIIKNANGVENLDVIPAGAIPPDPAELIDSPEFAKLIDELKERYDQIILDCPPTEPVTDSSVITRYVDRTVYVIRVGNLRRDFLDNLQEYYKTKHFTNMSVILNATELDNKKSQYGYGYGYGYGQNKEK